MASGVILRAATRRSALARRQTDLAAEALAEACGVEVVAVPVSTLGDRAIETPIHDMGGKGVFVKEVQAAVLAGRADIAVHSAKDLPSDRVRGLTLAAVLPRGDPRDALVGARLRDLRSGAAVATGSVRRRAQLARLRPDLRFFELRGNIATRLEKAADHDAILMAAVALHRLGLRPEVVDVLDPQVMVPQAGQGAIAVECRSDDEAVLALLAAVDHLASRRAVTAERAFLAELGGDCNLPAAVHAEPESDASDDLRITGLVASLDGLVMVRGSRRGADPQSLGRELALHLLDDRDGRAVLDAVRPSDHPMRR